MQTSYRLNLKILLITLTCMVRLTPVKAQDQDSTVYPLVIQFNSIGTGVPKDSAFRSYINAFKKKNKIKKITAFHIGPMGREGEYWLAFTLKELTKKQAAVFVRQMKLIAEKPKERGSTVFEENKEVIIKNVGRARIEKIIL